MAKLKTYTVSGFIAVNKLSKTIADAGYVNGFDGLRRKGTNLDLFGDSFADESGCDAEVASYVGLADYKAERIAKVKRKDIKVLEKEKFNHDSTFFPMAAPSRDFYTAIKEGKDLYAFPVQIARFNGGNYNLNKLAVDNFHTAYINKLRTLMNESRLIKNAIKDATTEAAVDAVEDNR